MSEEENSKEEKAPSNAEARLTIKDLGIDPEAFRAHLENIRRSAEGAQELVRAVNRIASSDKLEDFRQWYVSFAKDLERMSAATQEAAKQLDEVHRKLQQAVQHEGGLRSLREALTMDPAVVNQISVTLANLASGASRVTNVELPPLQVIEAVYTQALRAALEAEPPEDDETEADEWFAAVIFERAWTGLEKRGITQEEKKLILLVLAYCIFYLIEPGLRPVRDMLHPPAPLRSAVESESKLRIQAGDTAKVEALLKPGQDVEHLEEKGGWTRVRLFDEENEEYRIGWMKKEDLTTIEEEK